MRKSQAGVVFMGRCYTPGWSLTPGTILFTYVKIAVKRQIIRGGHSAVNKSDKYTYFDDVCGKHPS